MSLPDGLVRLPNMLLTYARAFAVTAASVEYSRGQISGLMLQGQHDLLNFDNDIGHGAQGALEQLKSLCGKIPSLAPVIFQLDRTLAKLEKGIAPVILYNEMEQLQHRVFDELRTHYYYPVTEAFAATYMSETPFGEGVYNNFPSARPDIKNAGKCIILGQGTAGVFHLMRVMEIALRVLGRDLKIEYAPSWESYVRQINKLIDADHKSKAAAWKRKEPFYKQVLGDLTSIKTAWRNPTMHVSIEYSPEDATTIYKAVMGLMEKMAHKNMKERGKPIARIVGLTNEHD